MPAAVALPIALGVGTAGAGIVGGVLQANAARDAAKLQTDAAGHAADVQAKSAADALAFQKQQAAQDLYTANQTQRANYDQWRARQGRLSNLAVLLGQRPFQIPDYVPITGADQVTPTGTPAGQRKSNLASLVGQ